MQKEHNINSTENYWSKRYNDANTGWDIGEPSRPLKTYIDQLQNKDLKILIPGAGNGYEAEYLFSQGFKNVIILDIAKAPLEAFQKRNPDFPSGQMIHDDFFKHEGKYDLILEQTFFCSFPPLPETRKTYAQKMFNLLKPNGKLVGLWFDIALTSDMEKRPFGGSKEEYLNYFEPYFEIKVFERCYNSITPRMWNELFGVLGKKL